MLFRSCLLPRRDVEQLGYSTGPYHRRIALLPEVNLGHALSLVTAGILIEAPIVRLERVAVGDIVAEDVEAIVYDLPEATGFDMLLGLSFLGRFSVTLDFRNARLTIA